MSLKKGVKLSPKWQLDASLLSRPVDLTPLVAMSRTHPDSFIEDDTLHRLVSMLLNEKNSNKSDKVNCRDQKSLNFLFDNITTIFDRILS